MAGFLACPFCREIYTADEQKTRCSECDIELQRVSRLPPSAEAQWEAAERGEHEDPMHARIPWRDFSRSRGVLLLLSACGLGLFFAPWVELVRPDPVSLSGFDLARGRAGWLWGGAVAYLVLIPLIWTRRSLYSLRGVRVVSAALAAMTLGEVAMLVLNPPESGPYLRYTLEWSWGLFASGAVSAAAVVAAARLGGSLPEFTSTEESTDSRVLH